ncbi:MAG: tRNA (adenosine(37)-N6)-dimethylallyltransferase MiaA [Alphaproteobacteria bacterium]|nr:tRNA (adenosine(37)-N6)-dimethylallyltransferase MiaA [Alphaproteobacteria bacterium]
MKTPRVVLIGGATASGKTAFAVRYAEKLKTLYGVGSAIINADSIQLYDELKIITAFPSAEDMAKIPHRLFGILKPHEKPSVAFWLEQARKEIIRLQAKGKVAIVCGGTGFYLNAIKNGIADIPDIPPSFRQSVFEKFQCIGRDAFFEELSHLDKEITQTLHKNNTQRILRAYEVAAYTGKPLTEWWKNASSAGYDVKQILLLPPKEELHRRCYTRIQKMMNNGAVEEVRDFVSRYPNYNGGLRKAIGYYEISDFLNGKLSKDECVEQMFIHTKQYAKRQMTWFKHQMG